jgi:hypothetical protein
MPTASSRRRRSKAAAGTSGAGTASSSAAASSARPLPPHAGLVVVGGGCHAAALIMRLLTKGDVMSDPNPPIFGFRHGPPDVRRHLFKTPVEEELKKSIVVLDRSGGWMLNWQRAYNTLDIQHLRSPEGLHPDPYDHTALPVYAKCMKMEDDMVEMTKLGRGKTLDGKGTGARGEGAYYHGPFTLPSVDLFAKFCGRLIDKSYGLHDLLYQGEVTGLTPLPGSEGFALEISRASAADPVRMTASNVVLARGPTSRSNLPAWAEPLFKSSDPRCSHSIAHAWQMVDANGTTGLRPEQQSKSCPFVDAVKPTDRVVVVGGGLTSGHLVTLLAKQGVQDIKLVLRGQRKVKQFDLILPWFGDDRWAKRRDFETASIPDKLEALMSDRDGGSMTPELDVRIQALEAEGTCTVAECVQIRSARWIGPEPTEAECACCMHEFESGDIDSSSRTGYWEILFDDDTDCHAEKIWLATGSRTDVSGDPLLQQLLAAHPIDMHRGLPDIGETLRWAEGVPLYVMGGLAALQLGPDAVNLAGGLRGAVRISAELKERLQSAGGEGGDEQAAAACGKSAEGETKLSSTSPAASPLAV